MFGRDHLVECLDGNGLLYNVSCHGILIHAFHSMLVVRWCLVMVWRLQGQSKYSSVIEKSYEPSKGNSMLSRMLLPPLEILIRVVPMFYSSLLSEPSRRMKDGIMEVFSSPFACSRVLHHPMIWIWPIEISKKLSS